MREKAELFNPAFTSLAHLQQGKVTGEEKTAQDKKRTAPREAGEDEVFMEAVRDVIPLSPEKTRVLRVSKRGIKQPPFSRDEELEVLTHLSDLVNGSIDMDITFSDEYMEGAVRGFSRKLMERLKKGMFPIQDYIDLHGLTRHEAEIQIRDFLLQSYRYGLRCVLVVHGRGLNSENHIPVLKERIPAWLSQGPVKKIVLAFSTSRPYDGGTGAIYILLRKRRGAL